MRIALVGSDCEENLGIAMIAAALLAARHQVTVIPFNEIAELDAVTDAVLRYRPQVIGLGMQFQHRSADFLQLGHRLRKRGFAGHVTCGGQYASLAWAELLDHETSLDSVVLYEGETSMVELCDAVHRRAGLQNVKGLALRQPGGEPARTPVRALCRDLDTLPFAHRYRAPARHLGLAFRPVWGSRGCWGSCAFCAITTYYRDARAHGGGRTVRLRSIESLAEEMAALWHAEGDTTLFCFHDETLLLPRPADSIARLGELRRQLDVLGVGQIGIIGKCRPDCVTPELAKELRRLGVVRMFVGVENGSQNGLDHLGRRIRLQQIEDALAAYDAAGIFVCYNLLLFEPDSTLEDVRENIDFMRRHAHIPVNFCRAEPYHGTPLYHRVKQRGMLLGSYLGWDYRIHDDKTELAFRIAAAAFRERNFDTEGVANRAMGLGYTNQLLRCFFNVKTVRGERLLERTDRLIRDISLDTAKFLEEAVNLAERIDLDDHDLITRETALLGLRVAAHNRVSHAVLDDLVSDICAYVDTQPRCPPQVSIPERARAVIERMTLAGCFAASLQACGGSTDEGGATRGTGGTTGSSSTASTGGYLVVDCAPNTGGSGGNDSSTTHVTTGGYLVYDMAPPTGGRSGTGGTSIVYFDNTGGSTATAGRTSTGGSISTGGRIAGDGGAPSGGKASGGQTNTGGRATGGYMISDPGPISGGAYGDWVPSSGGRTGTGGNAAGGFIVDCVVNASGKESRTWASATAASVPNATDDSAVACTVDPAPPQCSTTTSSGGAVVENWRDSGPRRLVRSTDLALYDPPNIRLKAATEARRIRVQVQCDETPLTYRWESEGQVDGDGCEVYWTPANEDDALCVAARGRGGIAVATLRASELT